MKRRFGQWLGAVFGVCALGVLLAQTTTPEKCTEAWLRQVCGDEDWHICYFLYGCWLSEAPAQADLSAPPPQAFVMNRLRVR